jgi:hypothetical protein
MKLAARILRRELHAPVKRWQVVLAVVELALVLLGLALFSAYGEKYVLPVLLSLVGLSAAVVASSLVIREWLHRRKKQRGFRLDPHHPAGDPPVR